MPIICDIMENVINYVKGISHVNFLPYNNQLLTGECVRLNPFRNYYHINEIT